MPKSKSVSRRDFVRGAALAVAAPTIISSRALGNAQTPAASERLTIGFIGIGKQSSTHLNKHSGMAASQVVAVCDVHTGRRDRAKTTTEKKYDRLERKATVAEFVDYHELLARKDIDAVVIGVPDHWHTAIAMSAVLAGKDVYCEKPLTLTIHEAKTLLDTVRHTKRVFQTGSQQRSEGPFRQACEYIQNGRIGKIKEVWVGVGATSKPCDLPAEETPQGIEWDMWLGQAPERPYNDVLCRKASDPGSYPFNPGWRDYREFSGGYVTDWGAHHFDITQWALGMDHSGPAEIIPPTGENDEYGAQLIYRGSKVGDEILVTHKKVVYEGPSKNARTGEVKQIKESNGIHFIGEHGKIFVNRSMIVSDPDKILMEPIHEDEIFYFKSPGHHEDWMNCIKTRNRPIADVEVGARSVTVCHLVNLAYWHHRKLNWDAKKWEFTGDAEANAWRDRARREKYQLPTMTA
ncbi:MAG TPA: Gfo/Idh/MocA family oxidoreductase [Tepidisphaeraceae bacterium]|jgi:predicted dehydrogenase